jgi:hypothetical protein
MGAAASRAFLFCYEPRKGSPLPVEERRVMRTHRLAAVERLIKRTVGSS